MLLTKQKCFYFISVVYLLRISCSKERNRAMPEPVNHQVNAARKTFQTLQQISKLLNTNLDSSTLSICVRLCENGVNPQALAMVVKELQKEIKALNEAQGEGTSKTSLNK